MNNFIPTVATPQICEDVINYFKSNKDNRSRIIAEHFGLKEHLVNTILSKHFKKCKNQK